MQFVLKPGYDGGLRQHLSMCSIEYLYTVVTQHILSYSYHKHKRDPNARKKKLRKFKVFLINNTIDQILITTE